jgi:hypothetical protein
MHHENRRVKVVGSYNLQQHDFPLLLLPFSLNAGVKLLPSQPRVQQFGHGLEVSEAKEGGWEEDQGRE